jgi:hypothetical protein
LSVPSGVVIHTCAKSVAGRWAGTAALAPTPAKAVATRALPAAISAEERGRMADLRETM